MASNSDSSEDQQPNVSVQQELLQQQNQLQQQLQQLQSQIQLQRLEQTNAARASSLENANADRDVAVLNITLPTFWRHKPQLWFYQIEGKFRNRGIRSDSSKYDAVLEALDSSAILEVCDIIESAPEGNKYEYLKQALIKRFSISTERQLHELLSEIELGDRKPSQLLRHMRELAQGKATDDLLRAKWLALLPASVHNTLKVLPKATLNELADVADSIMENTNPFVMSTSNFPPSCAAVIPNSLENRLSSLEKVVAELSTAVKKLTKTSQHRNRSRARSRSLSSSGECFYHRKFGDNAAKCTQPCTFKSKSTQGN
ncbi:hypothetical protein ABEB36_003875 [Hypothenemus hampei]|uniref:DUF7041 domain-containing protein n=1 Tax=Hypothenemus hampei TaxID=57062 RepID=A0ABD1F207_HYPHA